MGYNGDKPITPYKGSWADERERGVPIVRPPLPPSMSEEEKLFNTVLQTGR